MFRFLLRPRLAKGLPQSTMRAVLTLLLTFCACLAAGQDKAGPAEAPRNLEEAHQQLEVLLTKDELARIDAMKSEKEMIAFHLGIGMTIRNSWGLWGGSPLANNLWKLGFSHPDDMSAVILRTFWCKRHDRDFRLEERADYYQAYWKAAADPPSTVRDPSDQSEIEWILSFDACTDEKPRLIHIGRSRKSGRWLAYEFNRGVYIPDQELSKKLKMASTDPFTGKK